MNIKLVIENDGEEKVYTPKFHTFQTVYYVYKRFGKIMIVKTEISSISFTNIWNYRIDYNDYCFIDNSKSLYNNLDDAYKRAEEIDRRKNIKIID